MVSVYVFLQTGRICFSEFMSFPLLLSEWNILTAFRCVHCQSSILNHLQGKLIILIILWEALGFLCLLLWHLPPPALWHEALPNSSGLCSWDGEHNHTARKLQRIAQEIRHQAKCINMASKLPRSQANLAQSTQVLFATHRTEPQVSIYNILVMDSTGSGPKIESCFGSTMGTRAVF